MEHPDKLLRAMGAEVMGVIAATDAARLGIAAISRAMTKSDDRLGIYLDSENSATDVRKKWEVIS